MFTDTLVKRSKDEQYNQTPKNLINKQLK